MPLSFKKQRSHPLPFILAFAALLLAIIGLLFWIWVGFHRSAPPDPDLSQNDTSRYDESPTAIGRCLLILDYIDDRHFMLIQSDPVQNRITVTPIPAQLTDTDGNTLNTLLSKHGSQRVTQTVASILQLSVTHYITLDADGTKSFLDDLDSGVIFTLPEAIRYTDENGSQIQLKAGEHTLSAAQTAAVLRYTDWSNAAPLTDSIVADVITAILNQYLLPGRRFDGYFASLSNAAQTDLRIDNYNAFRTTLTQLANSNQGALCQHVDLALITATTQ